MHRQYRHHQKKRRSKVEDDLKFYFNTDEKQKDGKRYHFNQEN